MIVDNTFLYNCARNVALINEFPFIQQLHVKISSSPVNTGCCTGQRHRPRHSADMYNEVKKIIATMTRPNLDRFKDILKVKQLSVTYTDESGKLHTIEI
jgi:hypothetical protein